MIKKIVFLILIFTNFLFASNSLYVAASPSLILRDTPNLLGKSIGFIPFNSKVTFLEQKDEEITINNLKGKWVKIHFNSKEGWVFNPYLSFKPLDTKLWQKVFSINEKANNLNHDEEVKALFKEVVNSDLFTKSDEEFNDFCTCSFKKGNLYNLKYLVGKITPMNVKISNKTLKATPNISFFKSKSKHFSNLYKFFDLCEKGYVGLNDKLYKGKGIRPYWHTDFGAKKPWYFKVKAQRLLSKWKKLLPSLDSECKQIAQNTIKRLEWVLSRCEENKGECR